MDVIGHIKFLLWGQLDGCSMTRPFLSAKDAGCETNERHYGWEGGRVDRKGLRGEERGCFFSQELPLKTSQIQQCSLHSYTVCVLSHNLPPSARGFDCKKFPLY